MAVELAMSLQVIFKELKASPSLCAYLRELALPNALRIARPKSRGGEKEDIEVEVARGHIDQGPQDHDVLDQLHDEHRRGAGHPLFREGE